MSMLTEMETWGQVVTVHQIGELAIAEYHPWLAGHGRRPDLATTQYYGYYAGQDTARYYPTLEQAIVGTLAYHYDGHSSQAGLYFARMVGLPEQEADTAAVAPFEIDTEYFRWGHFVQTHALRDIRIVAFHPWTEKGWGKESDPAVTLYHAWFGDAGEARWRDTGLPAPRWIWRW